MASPGTPHEDDSDSWRILESALDAVVSIDQEGRIVRWNPQAERIFGWSAAEVTGKLIRETIVPPHYRQRHQRGFERYLTTGVAHILGQRTEVQGLHRDGREFPVELSIVELASAGAERFSAFIRDLSRERATEAQLDRAHRERRSLAESVGRMQPGATVGTDGGWRLRRREKLHRRRHRRGHALRARRHFADAGLQCRRGPGVPDIGRDIAGPCCSPHRTDARGSLDRAARRERGAERVLVRLLGLCADPDR